MEEDEVGKVNFSPCLCFVRRGVAKENPEKISLTQEELAKIIDTEQKNKRDEDDDGEDEDEEENENDSEMVSSDNESAGTSSKKKKEKKSKSGDTDSETISKYNFDDYDKEDGFQIALRDVAIIDPNENVDDEEDSDAEDDIIKKTDNIILVGHVENESSSLEVFIYNEEEGSLYVHHDIMLPAYPLCIEWLNRDPDTGKNGNLCAIGSMEPIITVWDLDIQDSLEPIFKLGSKGNKKKKIQRIGHLDAVLDLSWNKNLPHIIASGSVDQTVILWDIDNCIPNTTINVFNEKVQTIKFHPTESQHLLTGCCDNTIKLFDCRHIDNDNIDYKLWTLDSEIERVCWNIFNPNLFMASTNSGMVYYIDKRMDNVPLWKEQCHDQETTGLHISEHIPNMLTTTSADGLLKVWDITEQKATLVYTKEVLVGQVQCLDCSPDNPFTFAVGGDKQKKIFKVVDLNNDIILKKFGDRQRRIVEKNDECNDEENPDIVVDEEEIMDM